MYWYSMFYMFRHHHHGVKHDPAEIGAQCLEKQRRMGAAYCNRQRDDRDVSYLSGITFDSLMVEFKMPNHVVEH
jgi:hypothetical protein